jgi:hypothetical protein
MEITFHVIDLIVLNTDRNLEMTGGYILRVRSAPNAATVINFSASRDVSWAIRSQTGLRARFGSTSSTTNTLTIPANYRGTINIRVGGTRDFRVVVTAGPPVSTVEGVFAECCPGYLECGINDCRVPSCDCPLGDCVNICNYFGNPEEPYYEPLN